MNPKISFLGIAGGSTDFKNEELDFSTTSENILQVELGIRNYIQI